MRRMQHQEKGSESLNICARGQNHGGTNDERERVHPEIHPRPPSFEGTTRIRQGRPVTLIDFTLPDPIWIEMTVSTARGSLEAYAMEMSRQVGCTTPGETRGCVR